MAKTKIVAGRILKSGDESPHGLTDDEKKVRKLKWETPRHVFDYLDAKFHFGLDAAASPDNTLVPGNYLTEEDDALTVDWADRARQKGYGKWQKPRAIWCNPPFVGQGLTRWVKKMSDAALVGAEVVAIVPASVETAYWNHIFKTANAWIAYRGRMIFTYHGIPAGTPMGAVAIVIWSRQILPLDYLAKLGAVMTHWEIHRDS